MTLFNNFCAAILAVASSSRTAINDAARIIFGFFAAGTNAAVGFLPTIRRMKSATAFLAVAVAIPLMSACGGGGGGGGLPTPPSDTTADITHALAATVSVRTATATTVAFSSIDPTSATPIPAAATTDNLGTAYALFPVPAEITIDPDDDEGFSAAVYRKGGERMVVYRDAGAEVPIVTLTLTSDQTAFANLHGRTTVNGGTTTTFTADGAFYDGTVLSASRRLLLVENEYSAIGVWMSQGGDSNFRVLNAGFTGIGPGFATPIGDALDGTDRATATYIGNAIGSLRDIRDFGGADGGQAYLVYGESEFSADFTNNRISGGVILRAYNVGDAIQDGSVSGDSPLGTIAIDLATPRPFATENIFEGEPAYAAGTEANLGVFRGLINTGNTDFGAVEGLDREFNGRFYGPDAEEVAGYIEVDVDDYDPDTNPATDDDIYLDVQFAAER